MSGSPKAYCFGQVTYSACVLACTRYGFDHLGMVPVNEHSMPDIRMTLDNHYISGADVAVKNTSLVSSLVSCNVLHTVIRR